MTDFIKEYRKKVQPTKEVVAPSGFKFVLKRLNPFSLTELTNDFDLATLDTKANLELSRKLLVKGILSPPIVDADVGTSEALGVGELTGEDVKFLMDEILALSGTKKAEEAEIIEEKTEEG